MITGEKRTKEINVTQEQLDAWENGAYIQDVMPHLTPAEREFIITGITEEEWNETIKDED